MRFKRSVAALVAAVVILPIAVACGGSSPSEGGEGGGETPLVAYHDPAGKVSVE